MRLAYTKIKLGVILFFLFLFFQGKAQDNLDPVFKQLQVQIDSLLQLGQFEKVPELLEDLLAGATEIGTEQSLVITNQYFAKYHYYASEHEMSISYMFKAAAGYERLQDSLMASKMYNNISMIVTETGGVGQSLEYKKLALLLCPPELDAEWNILLTNNLANAMRQLGHQDSAATLLYQAQREARKIDYKRGLGSSSHLLSLLSIERGDFATAIAYCDTVQLRYANDVPAEMYESSVFSKATALFELGKLSASLEYARKSEKLLERGLSINLGSTYELLAKIYEKMGRYDSAFSAQKRSIYFKDSLFNLDKQEAILDLEKKYRTEKKEIEIVTLTQQNEIQELQLGRRNLLLLIIIIAAVSTIAVGYLVYNQRIIRRKKEANDLKQKLLRVQLNPHFMFNSLNAIQSMIYEVEDRQKTADYLSSFSSLMRNILELNQHDFISLEEELEFIKNYVDIQQIRFDNPIVFDLKVDDVLPLEKVILPPMISQPFLENCFEHGFPEKSKGGKIWIKMSQNGDNLEIKISDDGVGLGVSKAGEKEHNSLATKITKERLSNISLLFKRESGISIGSLSSSDVSTGTEVIIKLPLIYD